MEMYIFCLFLHLILSCLQMKWNTTDNPEDGRRERYKESAPWGHPGAIDSNLQATQLSCSVREYIMYCYAFDKRYCHYCVTT